MVLNRRRCSGGLVALLVAVVCLAGLVSAPAGAVTRPAPVARATMTAVVERLSVMPAVAYTKYRKHLPIVDPTREAQAELAFVSAATERGIRAGLARRVILAQFVAAKHVQRRLIRGWNAGTRPVPHHRPADLATDLRPKIDAATVSLLDALEARERLTARRQYRCDLAAARTRAVDTLRPALSARDLTVALRPLRPLR